MLRVKSPKWLLLKENQLLPRSAFLQASWVREFISLPFPALKAAQVPTLAATVIFKASNVELSLLSDKSYLLVCLPVALLRAWEIALVYLSDPEKYPYFKGNCLAIWILDSWPKRLGSINHRFQTPGHGPLGNDNLSAALSSNLGEVKSALWAPPRTVAPSVTRLFHLAL